LRQTARTYNIVVNHRHCILSTTHGHPPARWNDKTLVHYDKFATGLRRNELLQDVVFVLHEYNADGTIKEVTYKGAWIMVDNGYLRWSCTVPPHKHTVHQSEIHCWSRWLEAMQKDVECTFGILKGRWQVLKSGIRLWGVEACDKVWLTCCALHNWLLEVDGMEEQWESEMGQFEHAGDEPHHSLGHLSGRQESQTYDTSGMGRGNDIIEDENYDLVPKDERSTMAVQEQLCLDNDGYRNVRNMSLDDGLSSSYSTL
jgi:hypothetical protein